MKKLLFILALSELSTAAFSQGLINFANNIVTKISTNAFVGGFTLLPSFYS